MSLAPRSKFTEEQLLQELVRRHREELLGTYVPHPKQLHMHKSQALIRALFTGNQFGKTFWGCMEIAYTVGKCHPWRKNYTGKVWARDCCVDFDVIKKNLVPKYQEILPRHRVVLDWRTAEGEQAVWPGLLGGSWGSAYSAEDRAVYLEDGSFIEFKTYQQGREAMQGPMRHVIRFDEEPPDESIFDENVARQTVPGWNMLFTLTPINYSPWLYERIYQASASDPNIECLLGDTAENPHISPDTVALMESAYSDEAVKAARLHGQFTITSGRVYKEYGDHNLIDPFSIPDDWHKTVIIDPHPQKPTAVNWIAESYNGDLIVYREADLEGDVEEISNEIITLCAGEHMDLWLMDPSSKQRAGIRGQGALVDEFRKFLPHVHLANNDVDRGIAVVQQMVKPRPEGSKLRVSRACPVTHHQMTNYMWAPPMKTGEDRSRPKVFKRNDDHPDCIRYRAMWGGAMTNVPFSGWNVGGYAN